MEHGYVISDLHLFARRSLADDHLDAMHRAAEQADFFVLNGDIFDFRWTTLQTAESTAQAAVAWLEDFACRHPACRIFYVLGNHDSWEFFTRRLEELAARRENFRWFPSHVRIGSALFLHGDLPLGWKRRRPFHRRLPRRSRPAGRFLHACYDALILAGLHRLAGRWYGRRRCARRFLRALRRDANGLGDGLRDIYFGHTHTLFRDYHYRGMVFHNTGSTVQGLEGNLLRAKTRRESDPSLPPLP